MFCDCSHASVSTENKRKTLRVALVLNATMFVVGMAAGLWAQSSGLMPDALDMVIDATAYGLRLMAVTRGPPFKQPFLVRKRPAWCRDGRVLPFVALRQRHGPADARTVPARRSPYASQLDLYAR
jgi:hypothetical protein